jgi:predicted AAA+ superfamily ATPase
MLKRHITPQLTRLAAQFPVVTILGPRQSGKTTLASWLSVLEASFVVFRLPCYFNNFGKRLVKAPKNLPRQRRRLWSI